jgi:hypothetical protein
MSFIKTSKQLYRQVEALEKETSDHEISMARGELETIADRALATSAMLEGTPDIGNPLPAWVQSKITNACDYITTVHDYLKYSPKLNESVSLDETTFEKIYQMQQDGKSVEDIAKELNLKSDLVKKVLGESKTISEGLSDAQIAQLKKEYEPLKGKTITTSQYQQLKNILFKLQDGDLEKLQKQNIPFASTGAGSILRVRKAPVKITNVKVPGLEGMAEENQYVAVHTKKGKTSVTANSSYEAAKKASEKFGLNDTTGITVMLSKKDGEDVIHKATEEVELKPVPSLEDSAKKHNVDIEVLKKQLEKGIQVEKEHTKDEKVAEKIALAHIDERPDYYVQIDKLEKKPVEKVAEVKEPTGDLKDACWTGYVAVGTKMKNGKRVPNCVPKSEAYKGAKAIVENAFKKLKEKK